MVALVNGASSTLNGSITNSATTITLASGTGARFPTGDFTLTIDDGTNREIVYVPIGGRSTDTLSNCVRAYESYAGATTAYAFASGVNVAQTVTAATMNRQFAGGTMQTYTNQLAADVALSNANQFYDGPTLTLPPGTWLLTGTASLQYSNSVGQMTLKIWDGTNNFASTQETVVGTMSQGTMSVDAVVSPTVQTTYRLSAASSITGQTLKAATTNNSAGNTATTLVAVQLLSGGSSSAYAPSEQYALVVDQKTAGTSGGTFTSGAYRTRDLNTILANTGNWLSLASNQITLPAGTYRTRIQCPAWHVDQHIARLQNITLGSTVLSGSSCATNSGGYFAVTYSIIEGRFTLTATTTLEVQHRCLTTESTDGFGSSTNMGVTETYTVAQFWLEQQGIAPNGSKLLLSYQATTDVANGISLTNGTWADIGTAQSFTVDDGNALIEVSVLGNVDVGSTGATTISGSRIQIDGTTNYQLGGGHATAGGYANSLAGSAPLSIGPLGTGTHTVKLQVVSRAGSGSILAYCQPATNPTTDSLRILVRQIPQATTTLSPAVANGAKVLLDWINTASLTQSLGSTNTWTDVTGASWTFTVDDPNAIVSVEVSGNLYGNLSGTATVGSRLVLDPSGANVIYSYGGESAASGYFNFLAGALPPKITGLSVGVHTVKLQVSATVTGTVYLDAPGTSPLYNFLRCRIIQQPQVQATPVGGTAGDKLLLNYQLASDIANGSQAANTWNNFDTAKTFVVDDPSATIEVLIGGNIELFDGATNSSSAAVLVDGTTRYMLGGGITASSYSNPLAGSIPVPLSGLATGSHTVQLQLRHSFGTATYTCNANSTTWHSLAIRVWQRPTIYRGGSVPSARVSRVASQSISGATWTAISWDTLTFDTDNITQVGGANPTRLTCRTPGKYEIGGSIFLTSVPSTGAARILLNGTTVISEWESGYAMQVRAIYPLNVGDYVELMVYASPSANSTNANSGNTPIFMEMARIGDVAQGGPVKYAEVVLTATQATVTLPVSGSLPQNYRNIRITGQARGDAAATEISLFVQFNGDSGANYNDQQMVGYGSTVAAGTNIAQSTGILLGDGVSAANAPSGAAGVFEILVPNYSGTTFRKGLVARTGLTKADSSSNVVISDFYGEWKNTSAITSVTILTSTGNIVTGSTFTLYLEP